MNETISGLVDTYTRKPVAVFEQGTDEAIGHGFVSREEQLALLKINSLYFDSLTMRAPDILSNPNYHKLSEDAIRVLFAPTQREDGSMQMPIIRPAANVTSMVEVADRMRDSATRTLTPGEDDEDRWKAQKHLAETIDKLEPKFIQVPYQNQVMLFQDNCVRLFAAANKTGFDKIRVGTLSELVLWLKDEPRSNTEIWNRAEQHYSFLADTLKHMSHAAQQHAFAGQVSEGMLSYNRQLEEFLNALDVLPADGSSQATPQMEHQLGSIPWNFPAVERLDWDKIAKLRAETCFVFVRHMLSFLRAAPGKVDSLSEDWMEHFIECSERIGELCGQTKGKAIVIVLAGGTMLFPVLEALNTSLVAKTAILALGAAYVLLASVIASQALGSQPKQAIREVYLPMSGSLQLTDNSD